MSYKNPIPPHLNVSGIAASLTLKELYLHLLNIQNGASTALTLNS